LLTYALPHLAVLARIELIQVHLAVADMARARRSCGKLMKCSGFVRIWAH